jgi:hypothetical protein
MMTRRLVDPGDRVKNRYFANCFVIMGCLFFQSRGNCYCYFHVWRTKQQIFGDLGSSLHHFVTIGVFGGVENLWSQNEWNAWSIQSIEILHIQMTGKSNDKSMCNQPREALKYATIRNRQRTKGIEGETVRQWIRNHSCHLGTGCLWVRLLIVWGWLISFPETTATVSSQTANSWRSNGHEKGDPLNHKLWEGRKQAGISRRVQSEAARVLETLVDTMW